MKRRTKKAKIEFKQVYMSSDFVKFFDIKRKLEMPDLDRISYSKFEADRIKEDIFKKKKRGFFDDFKI